MQNHLAYETSIFPSFSEIAMLLVRLLAIGFMVWFLIALVRDGNRKSAQHRLRFPVTFRPVWKPESDPAATWRCLLPIILFALLSRSSAQTPGPNTYQDDTKGEIQQLRNLVQELQSRIVKLESQQEIKQDLPQPSAQQSEAFVSQPTTNQQQTITADDRNVLDFFRETRINLGVDGYYGYNFNRPVGRVNLLRAYDVSSNSFSLNQANIILEQAPDVASGRRFGARLDLQYGQASESSQGNPGNELRPQAYRPIWQAYGTYIFPLGKGLTVDFGKWASSLGVEGNYTKDQINYSRSYFFNFLPYYHTGVRATYQFNNFASLAYCVVSGVGQAEDFNTFKSQLMFATLHPSKTVSWNINYYGGQEQRDVVPILNPGLPANQPSLDCL